MVRGAADNLYEVSSIHTNEKNICVLYGDGKPACLINVLHSLHVEDGAHAMPQPLPGSGAGAVHLSPDMKSVS